MLAKHLRVGRSGEDLAASYLRKKGYKILDRNWRCNFGELDLVCRHKQVIVFVEVKTRSASTSVLPSEALTHHKRKRLLKTATLYLSKNGLWDQRCRFDLICVILENNSADIEHVQNAFEFTYAVGSSHSSWQPW
ncbi:YraN family protein [Desulfovulcanus sp.]